MRIRPTRSCCIHLPVSSFKYTDTHTPLSVCQVYLNGERLPVRCFADYVDLYLGPRDNGVPRVYERISDRWEVVVSATDGQFQQVQGAGEGVAHLPYLAHSIIITVCT